MRRSKPLANPAARSIHHCSGVRSSAGKMSPVTQATSSATPKAASIRAVHHRSTSTSSSVKATWGVATWGRAALWARATRT
jgi:hypothetical protein